ncbi:GNAT family N-acetyltransferase [Avibacterium sp. 21-586]|uniref:GNAT family N-acetyltransferase n=1 Tax=Avibacterium sp. 21-586 TaxID=2911534 RepID=UPI0022457807|nr:GNAT family N-acetyltransferase [Avibacterium sp. 21-586]MCW9710348.1 GNAT family N-acetyltransferase [Avibacterium sp. 21-586]
MEIRLLQAEDFTQWQPLWQGYLTFYQTSLDDVVTQHTWHNISSAAQIQGLGAFDGEKLVGFAHIVIHPNTWNTTPCCYLEDLFVAESYRGRGIGKQLIEYIYQLAEKQQFNRVYWMTDRDNHTAQKLYDKLAKQTSMVQYRKDIK